VASMESLLTKLSRLGIFPDHPPSLPSQPSFFLTTLSTSRSRITKHNGPEYASYYAHLLSSLGSIITVQKIVASLFGHLNMPQEAMSCSSATRAAVKKEAQLLLQLTGGDDELLRTLIDAILAKDYNEAHARVLVCCISGAGLINVSDAGR
jgi:telomere length regulation protein